MASSSGEKFGATRRQEEGPEPVAPFVRLRNHSFRSGSTASAPEPASRRLISSRYSVSGDGTPANRRQPGNTRAISPGANILRGYSPDRRPGKERTASANSGRRATTAGTPSTSSVGLGGSLGSSEAPVARRFLASPSPEEEEKGLSPSPTSTSSSSPSLAQGSFGGVKPPQLPPLRRPPSALSIGGLIRPGSAVARPSSAFSRPQLGASEPTASCFQILEYLFMGGIGVSMNAQLLCKAKIEYLINASGMQPQDLPSEQKSTCPCLCPNPTAHSRVLIDLNLDSETGPGQIVEKFVVVNDIIRKARAAGKKVLIFSYDGKGRAPALVLQYAMWYWKWSASEARVFLFASLPLTILFKPNYETALRHWQQRLALPSDPDKEAKNEQLLKPRPGPQARQAWASSY